MEQVTEVRVLEMHGRCVVLCRQCMSAGVTCGCLATALLPTGSAAARNSNLDLFVIIIMM